MRLLLLVVSVILGWGKCNQFSEKSRYLIRHSPHYNLHTRWLRANEIQRNLTSSSSFIHREDNFLVNFSSFFSSYFHRLMFARRNFIAFYYRPSPDGRSVTLYPMVELWGWLCRAEKSELKELRLGCGDGCVDSFSHEAALNRFASNASSLIQTLDTFGYFGICFSYTLNRFTHFNECQMISVHGQDIFHSIVTSL